MDGWLQRLREYLPHLRAQYRVQRLWLFGPHARGQASPGTPLDLLAEIDGALTYEQFNALQAALSEWLAMPVELVLKGDMPPDVAEIVAPEMVEVQMSDFF